MSAPTAHRRALLALALVACGRAPSAMPNEGASVSPARSGPFGTPLVLAVDEGERRVRRAATAGGAPFIIKVDRRNGGAPNFMMGYEEIRPGASISPHVHPDADEIIFVHKGAGAADAGDHTGTIGPGSTIYIPRRTRITLRNTGGEPLAIAFFFDHPGFEEYLRDTSTPERQPASPLSPAELAAIRVRHHAHVVYERP
ncbi:Cupin 2 conserved barrel domain protein [Gemmatirosa kalamazoonensis]|uniref:Cupin 2 conserved barrel domain protein n=1 Tax=Gemmatirosa kalamazoonensis TaxID=861299 RepID=W0RDP2_9BACT|nr:cupin domain-containing protein [Gemmatirosa kalamazoonensis]AHG88562.1 Cupin 2 conserved barrel domain protein [Gemmatirosa kalamazoonensis]